MAKKAAFLTLLILIISATFAAAQESDSKRAEIYPKTMAIHRVYPHQLGYKVEYIKSNRTLGSFYAPLEWFKKSAGYGEIVYGQGRAYPYATFYYKGRQDRPLQTLPYRKLSGYKLGNPPERRADRRIFGRTNLSLNINKVKEDL